MKPDIHPEYRTIAFEDASTGERWLCGSVAVTPLLATVDGVEYPLVQVEVSNLTHPYYTGKMKLVDSGGRLERFERRYGSLAARRGRR